MALAVHRGLATSATVGPVLAVLAGPVLIALSGTGPVALAGQTRAAAETDAVLAFCRPLPATAGCICSVEAVEQPLTPGQFIRHMRQRRAAGATSAAELRLAEEQAAAACGGAGGLAAGAPVTGGRHPALAAGPRRSGSGPRRFGRSAATSAPPGLAP